MDLTKSFHCCWSMSWFHCWICSAPLSGVSLLSRNLSFSVSSWKCGYSWRSILILSVTGSVTSMTRDLLSACQSGDGQWMFPMRLLSASVKMGLVRSNCWSVCQSWVSNFFCEGCADFGVAPSSDPLWLARASRSSTCPPCFLMAVSSRVFPTPVRPERTCRLSVSAFSMFFVSSTMNLLNARYPPWMRCGFHPMDLRMKVNDLERIPPRQQ